METVLHNYLQKCQDYSVKPKNRFIKELNDVIKNKQLMRHVILNGNCASMFEDRLTDIELFPLCELLEDDVQFVSLDVSYNLVGDYGSSAIARLIGSNKYIKHLSLKGNEIGEKGSEEIAESLANNTGLVSLDISENSLGDYGGMQILRALSRNNTLTTLNLNGTSLRTSAVTYAAIILRDHASLKTIKLAKPLLHSLQEDTCVHLAEMFKLNKQLTSVDLSHHGIRTEGISLITRGLMFNSTLQQLKLTGNQISVDGITFFCKYITSPTCSLVQLDLSCNEICNAGCIELTKSLSENNSITSLDITNNSIRDAGLEAIGNLALSMIQQSSLPRIRKLFVLGNVFDQRSIEVFAGIQAKNEERLKKKKKKAGHVDAIELDVVTYKVDETFFVTEKKDCVLPTPHIDTKPEQTAEIERLLGIESAFV